MAINRGCDECGRGVCPECRQGSSFILTVSVKVGEGAHLLEHLTLRFDVPTSLREARRYAEANRLGLPVQAPTRSYDVTVSHAPACEPFSGLAG